MHAIGLVASACGNNTTTAVPILAATSATTTTVAQLTTPTTITVASIATATTALTTTNAATTASSTLPQLLFVGNLLVSGYGLSNTDSFPYQTWKLLGMDKYDMQNLGMNSN
ncbi:MAG: hypothetical protein HXX08_14545 [Chloroflexi bacterium]|uniref:Uncharacterized protein n=1 Tax=Candidatus Chlorohelix allophototropha TaxID=3003348 RepID=A0A8T7M4U4_9CHLR|nr:hypothetical protein [Chloroflexota bacterium]WJW70390.1 hypothetical protein OZ401_004966 [Chloroflexota bacterium L227-S17]